VTLASQRPGTIAWALVLLGCFASAQAAPILRTNELPADTLIVLQRGACERRCAVYNIAIFADGSVIFDGRHYVRQAGLAKTTITREAVRQLLEEAMSLGFFQMKARYGFGDTADCEMLRSDAPTAVLSISSDGMAKTIVHNQGCVGPTSEGLKKFEERIDKAVNSTRWVK
jgi:hypothetical protein